MAFKELPKVPHFPSLEEGILRFWQREKIFEKSLKQTKEKPSFVIFEGPPTANGKPHIGHVVTRIFKDIVPRYKTMRGFYVLRKGGWDTHGLPVEIEVEKELGLSGKQDIENLVPGDPAKSIAKFNELCQRSVWKYVELWKKMIERVGNWFDLEHAYVTYEKDYVESVWWAFKEYWKRGLLYRGYKVVPYCTRCGTPLSSHEVAQGYEEVTDTSVYVTFPVVGEKSTFLLAWTTAPWTLPSSAALAVDPKADYVKAKDGERYLILAKNRALSLGLIGTTGKIGTTEVIKTFKGSELLGRAYQPLYPFLRSLIPKNVPSFMVVEADFVSLSEGSGIVHTGVMYGEEDFALGQKLGLPQRHLVDRNGRFLPEAGWLAGKYVKDADPLIIHDLKGRNLIWREEKIRHQYPFCWRCHRPLLYYALDSWFVKTTAVKEELKKNNRSVNWLPEYVGKGQMGNWYETLIDWSMSRNRYWGTPLPAWVCDKNPEHIEVIGSYDELSKKIVTHVGKTKRRLPKDFDPHRPFIDELTWVCPKKDGGVMHRTPEVTDVWHDAGSMPFAQWHYPFENREMIDKGKQFPADYISEAIDQTRGWFFSLMAVSTMLFGKSPYKNVVVFAHALDEKGRKMSKHLGNVIDPWESFREVGADPVRWFFLTAVTIGTSYRVSMESFREVIRRFFLILWNSVLFFDTYANFHRWHPSTKVVSTHILDRWLGARLAVLREEVTAKLDSYDFPAAGRAIQDFVINDLSTWYIRRCRDRVSPEATDTQDTAVCLANLHDALRMMAILLAPFTPFLAELIWQNLRGGNDPDSVHLAPWPQAARIDRKVLREMTEARRVVEEGLRLRKERGVKLRQPLGSVKVSGVAAWPTALSGIVASELNVKEVNLTKNPSGRVRKKFAVLLDTKLTAALKEEGTVRELIRAVQGLRKQAGYKFHEKVALEITTDNKELERLIRTHQAELEASTLSRLGPVGKPDAETKAGDARVAVAR